MAAIVDLNNHVPTGNFHLDASTYGGSYLVFNGTKGSSGDTLGSRVGPFRALNSNGQQLSISDHLENLGFFISGSRQETDRRIDPPVSSLFHDHGFDYFLYGKFDYILSDVDYLTSNSTLVEPKLRSRTIRSNKSRPMINKPQMDFKPFRISERSILTSIMNPISLSVVTPEKVGSSTLRGAMTLRTFNSPETLSTTIS